MEELSGSRIAEAGRRWRDERAVAAPPKACLPIEAPRARRVYNCSIGAPSARIVAWQLLSSQRCFVNVVQSVAVPLRTSCRNVLTSCTFLCGIKVC